MRTTVTLVAAILAFATLPVAAQSRTCPPPGSSGPTIDEVRRQRPELRGLSNDDLIDMLRREYYPKLSKEEVACRVGAVWSAPKPASEVSGKPQLSGGPVNKSRRILVNKHPIAFSIISPKGWVEGEIVSGNTKVSITSPPGKPFAECNVISRP